MLLLINKFKLREFKLNYNSLQILLISNLFRRLISLLTNINEAKIVCLTGLIYIKLNLIFYYLFTILRGALLCLDLRYMKGFSRSQDVYYTISRRKYV